MQSANDKAFYRSIAPIAVAIHERQNGPFEDEGDYVDWYRRMIAHIDTLKWHSSPPSVGAYHPSVELRAGLSAGIAVPHGHGPFPVILHAHGCGYLAGDAETFRRTSLDFAHGGFVTVMPNYGLAPERPFPGGFDDMTFAASWLSDNIGRYGGDASRIIISGNSVGGGMAYSLARSLMATPLAKALKGVAGFDGIYDWRGIMTAGIKVYLQGHEELVADPRVSAAVDLKAGMLPPALFLSTGSADFAAPSTLQFAQVLREQRVPFQLHLLDGNGHDAARYPQLDSAREVIDLFLRFAWQACNQGTSGDD